MAGRRLRLAAVGIGGAALLWLVLSNGIAAGAAGSGDAATAVAVAPDADRLSARAEALFFANRFGEAIAMADRSLAISPIQVRAVRVIGQAQLALGHDDAGLAAMNAAALGGWRDNVTQLWTLQMALYAGDNDSAMQRADALIRRATIPDPVLASFRAMMGNPGFRKSLIARLADQPDWRGLLFLDFRRAAPGEIPGIAQLIADLDRAPHPATDLELFPIVERLLELGQIAPAYDLWRARAPRGGWSAGNLVYDGGFTVANARRAATPPRFEWWIDPDASGLASIEAAPNGGGAALRVRSDAGVAATLAAEALTLAPGSYTLTMRIFARGEQDLAGFAFTLGCTGGADLPLTNTRVQQLRIDQLEYSASAAVPAGCARQDLKITARGGTPVGATISITDVAVRRAS